jgi:protein-S-isoprenylcysteine O-methyltransferase Ste14
MFAVAVAKDIFHQRGISGFWLKTSTEERFMVAAFGEEYVRYQHEVRALVPFPFWKGQA